MQYVKQWFNGLPANAKRKVVIFGALAAVILSILVTVLFGDSGGPAQRRTSRNTKVEASLLTGRDPARDGMDQLAAIQKRQDTQIEGIQRQLATISNHLGVAPGQRGGTNASGLPYPNGGRQDEVVGVPGSAAASDVVSNGANGSVTARPVTPVAATQRAVDQAVDDGGEGAGGSRSTRPQGMRPSRGSAPGARTDNSDVYGASGMPADGLDAGDQAVPEPPPLELRVLSPRGDATADPGDVGVQATNATYTQPRSGSDRRAMGLASQGAQEPEYYLPLGSIISGTLINGVAAPARGAAARKDPIPVTLRVKHEVILPNGFLLDLRECLVVASASADRSSERVMLRAEGLSCLRQDGAIMEAVLDASGNGPDGKAGVHGRVVDRTGDMVTNSAIAGAVGGIAKGFKPTQSSPITLNPGGGTGSFVWPDPAYVGGSALLGGAAGAADRIGETFAEIAKEYVPVVEINAGVPVDFTMVKGTPLRFKKVGEISRGTASQQYGRNDGSQAPAARAPTQFAPVPMSAARPGQQVPAQPGLGLAQAGARIDGLAPR